MFLTPTGNTNRQSMGLSPSYSSDVALIQNKDSESDIRLQMSVTWYALNM